MRKRKKNQPIQGRITVVWEGLRFWLPIVLSLTTVTLSALQWIDTHQQRRLRRLSHRPSAVQHYLGHKRLTMLIGVARPVFLPITVPEP
jgi:hypothetical protein